MQAALQHVNTREPNPVWLAQSRLRRRRFDDTLDTCSQLLERNPYDQASLHPHAATTLAPLGTLTQSIYAQRSQQRAMITWHCMP